MYSYVYSSIHIYIRIPIYLSIYPSIHPFIYASIYLSIYLPIYLSIYLSIHLSIVYTRAESPTLHDPGVAGLKRRLMPSPRALSCSRSGNTEFQGATHRLLSSSLSFLGLPYRILNKSRKKGTT